MLLVDFTLNLVFKVIIYGIDRIDGVSAGVWSCTALEILLKSDALLMGFIKFIFVLFVRECTLW